MIDKFKPKLPRLPYHSFHPSTRRLNNHRIFHGEFRRRRRRILKRIPGPTSTMVARELALAASTGRACGYRSAATTTQHRLAATPTRSSIPPAAGYHYPDNLPEGHPGHYYPEMPPYPVIAP